MNIIRDEAKKIMLEKIKEGGAWQDKVAMLTQMRDDFTKRFTRDYFKNMTSQGYFPGSDKNVDCLGYELEWGTIPLGSIKGGAMSKFGSADQFQEIKKLLIHLTSLSNEPSVFYKDNGDITEVSRKLIAASLKIRGMKTGLTVLGKLLSIYYPNTFIPFFNDQGHYLKSILKDYTEDSTGLESFIKNNYLLLKIREYLEAEPAFIKEVPHGKITNDFFAMFLLKCFPKSVESNEKAALEKKKEEEKFEALEAEHYQKLIHLNFRRLFKNYRYCDEGYQNSHEGHFDAEDAGIMDFLCVDENDDFVVIELKRKGTDVTLAQICRYMGWVRESLAKENQKVLGLIVSESKDIRLEYAIKVVPNVTLKQMRLGISIDDFGKWSAVPRSRV